MSERRRRTAPEWITFGVCCAVVLAVVALLGSQLFAGEEPAAPVAQQRGAIRQSAGTWYVPVDVTNEGDLTAADVQVVAELTIGGQVTDGEQIVAFLGGRETERLVFAFEDDPTTGQLEVRVGSYAQP